jgi:hypothetical protein
MGPTLKEHMAGKDLILPAEHPVPYSLRNALWHIRAKERIVNIHIEMERKRGVAGHGAKLHNSPKRNGNKKKALRISEGLSYMFNKTNFIVPVPVSSGRPQRGP